MALLGPGQTDERKRAACRQWVALQDSAGRPTGEEGGSFIVDLVLEEFPVYVLAISPFPPPTHFHLNIKNTHNLTSGLFPH